MSTKSPLLALALLPALAGAALAQGTPEQRAACTPEVFRLCDTDVPNVQDITACLARKRVKLSPACRAAMAPALPPDEPVAQAAAQTTPRAPAPRAKRVAAKPAAKPAAKSATTPATTPARVSADAEPAPAPAR